MTKSVKVKIGRAPKSKIPAWIWIIVSVALLGILYFTFSQEQESQKGKLTSEVSVEEASLLRDQGAFILDVREQSEWDQFHIPGATLIPLGTLSGQLDKVPKDKVVVVVCRTGRRSAEGRDILLKAGYKQVTSMNGGLTEWQSRGHAVETGK